MNECFLPAVKKVLDGAKSQEWDFDYELNKAKYNAVGIEGHIHSSQRDWFRQQLHADLDPSDILSIWNICRRQLQGKMSYNSQLKAFRGFQLFINAKNYKY